MIAIDTFRRVTKSRITGIATPLRGNVLNLPGSLNSKLKETLLVSYSRVGLCHVIYLPSTRVSNDPSCFCNHRVPQRQTRVPTH